MFSIKQCVHNVCNAADVDISMRIVDVDVKGTDRQAFPVNDTISSW